jgi:hypothetical protein
MTDQAEPGSRQERAKPVDAARQWTRRTVLNLVHQSGGGTVTGLMLRDMLGPDMDTSDAEPIAGILAVRRLEHAAREFTPGYIRQVHEDGYTWHEIGAALYLGASAAHRSVSLAEAAYDDLAADPDGEHARRYGHTFAWTCPAYRATVSDQGRRSGPADDEQGHADGCPRLIDAIAAREAQ